MDQKIINALRWIIGLFNRNNVPYRIGGGFAARMYGSNRPLKDIDFGIPEKYFPVILPAISEYLTYGPNRYKDAKWDLEAISLNYHGQDIDISGTDTMMISNKDRTKWISRGGFPYNTVVMNIQGIDINVMNPFELIEYKKELDGEHQLVDIEAVQEYITKHEL